jgi:Tfp pilus assembly protein PilO
MKKNEKKKPNKIIVISALIIVVALISGIVLIYMPFANKNRSLRSQILDERDRNVLIGKIRGIGKHLKIYNKAFPEARDVSWLLGEVSDMASKEHIEVASIKPGMPEDRGLCTELNIVLDTVSTYHQLGKFLSRIESSEKFLRIASIAIKRVDIDETFKEGATKFKRFDVKSHIVISTFVLRE